VLGTFLLFKLWRCRALFPPSPCDPSVQGGKNGGRRELYLPWVKNVDTHFRSMVWVVLIISSSVVGSAWWLKSHPMATPQIICYK
jgi:hypothetical protein